ncbi:metal-dependent transcriptional regulator, partial [Algoriphagus aestuarii]|nr:metal-dependent transcriptional regulator [Algoriphagus aestuarii]
NSSVSGMLRKLGELGLVDHQRYGDVRLTPTGDKVALAVLRRHRLIELYLVEELGYSWDEVHDEAEVLEHVVSDRFVERIAERLGHPTVDPHGDPIPTSDGRVPTQETRLLAHVDPGSGGRSSVSTTPTRRCCATWPASTSASACGSSLWNVNLSAALSSCVCTPTKGLKSGPSARGSPKRSGSRQTANAA